MSKWDSLEPLTRNIIKTGSAAAGVFGIAHVIKLLRTKDYSLPEFENDINEEELAYFAYDYTMINAFHRIYVMIKREENHTTERWNALIEATTLISKFMKFTLEDEDVKQANRLIDKIDKKLGIINDSFKTDYLSGSIVSQDIDLVSSAVSAHLHNLMIDKYV